MARYVVVMEPFGELLRLGLRVVLDEAQCEIVDGAQARPVDAVLFDMDQPDCAAVARELLARHGCRQAIACSSSRPVMRVFEPGKASSERPLTVAGLCLALTPHASRRWSPLRWRGR